MLWVNEIKLAKNEIDTVEEWNGIQNQEWDIHCEWNEMNFISFMVADQDASWQLSRIHDVDGTYYWGGGIFREGSTTLHEGTSKTVHNIISWFIE